MRFLFILLLMTTTIHTSMNAQNDHAGRYAHVNGLDLYYEVHGNGTPLVLLHGGGSTIQSNWARILPLLAKTHQVIAVELQAHGHTADRDQPLSFAQDADDVAALLRQLHVTKADIMGFSNGGTTTLQLAIRHPQLVNKIVLASAASKRSGLQPGFFEGMAQASLDNMPAPLKDAYLAANADPEGLKAMCNRDIARMLSFTDIPDDDIRAIQVPALVINGDHDVIRNEHALELSQLLPHGRLAILPASHGDYIGEVFATTRDSNMPEMVVEMIDVFLKD